MGKLRVVVTGFVNEEFEGSDKQVEKYLLLLKKRQEDAIEAEDMKWYKKEMPTYTPKFKSTMIGYSSKYNTFSNKYRNNDFQMEKFREKHKSKGLKIKIEHL